jgi:hypothetical protein
MAFAQDLASRFTMDSATEFLFAHDVHSLAAGLPYPHYNPSAAASNNVDHPANKFARAFDEAQKLAALRVRRGRLWPLNELFKDKVGEQIEIVRDFVDPIVTKAIEKKRERESVHGVEENKEVKDGESLLEHLVKLSDGASALILSPYLVPLTSF